MGSAGTKTKSSGKSSAPSASKEAAKSPVSAPAAAGAQVAKGPGSNFKDEYTYNKDKDLLGKGNYSSVYKAKQKATGLFVAAKVIDKKKLTKEDDDALKVEVDVLRNVNHPNVIQFYGWYADSSDNGFYYLCTELMEGGELFDSIVERDYYSEADAQEVVRALTSCLDYLHSKGIVHRDLKPENILLKSKKGPGQQNSADIKLADFGFARYLPKDGKGCTTACGTPGYVAPEIIVGMPYTTSVDVWSLGIIVYILLCGYPPFYHNQQNKLFQLIRKAKYEFDSPYWDNISESAKDLIRHCLTVDISSRFTIKQVKEHPWISTDASSTPIDGLLQELQRFNARRKLRAGIKAAIAANTIMSIVDSLKVDH